MHVYATNSSERKGGMLMIAGLSIFLALVLNDALTSRNIIAPWWFDTPSVAGFFGLVYWLFNRYIWKAPILHAVGLIKVPNLNGTWFGDVRSSFEEPPVLREVEVNICQTWREILVKLESNESRSESVMGAIFIGGDGTATLTYEYSNEPRALAADTMHAHRGTAYVQLQKDERGDLLAGDYYSGRGRQNIGQITLRRGPRPSRPAAATANSDRG